MSLTASEIGNLLVAMDEVFDDAANKQLARPTPTIRALAENQLCRFGALENVMNGCRVAEVVFLVECSNTVDDCSSLADCDIAGNNAESRSYAMPHNLCKWVDFGVTFESCNNVFTPDRQRAFQIARHIYKLETALNDAAIAHLNNNSQDVAAACVQAPGVLQKPIGTAADPGDYIGYADDQWDSSIIGKLLLTCDCADLFNPFFISGGLLYEDYVAAQYQNPACCDNDRFMLNQGPTSFYYDTRNLDQTISNGGKNVFAVDPSMYAFWSANRFSNDTPMAWNDKNNTWVWRVASPTLRYMNGGVVTPVYYDVMRQVTCDTNGGKHFQQENYRIMFNGGLHQAPDTDCPPVVAGNPANPGGGIIHFGNLTTVTP